MQPSSENSDHPRVETILIVEDDWALQRALRRLFENVGFKVEACGDGRSALDRFRTIDPAAIILDLGLPVISGYDVCREIRRETQSPPIIVVSAVSDEREKIRLLELGADDYITKPFSPRELLARVSATIRRTYQPDSSGSHQAEFGDVFLDFTKMELRVSGKIVDITTHEFRMLSFLVKNADRVVQRHEVLTNVLGYDENIRSRTMDNLILKLRQKLEKDPANPTRILTVRGIGYRFAP